MLRERAFGAQYQAGFVFILCIGLWALVYGMLLVLGQWLPAGSLGRIPLGGQWLYVQPLIACLALVLTALFVVEAGVGLGLPRWALVIAGLLCVVVLNLVHSPSAPWEGSTFWTAIKFLIGDLCIIGAALAIGTLVSDWVNSPGWILPICCVAIVVDVWSAFWGPTHAVASNIERAPELAQRLVVHYPNLLPSEAGISVEPSFGIGDFIFLALFVALARRYRLRMLPTRLALVAALIVAMLASAFTAYGIPALPFMAAGFLVANAGRLEVHRRDLVVCSIFAIALVAILVLVVNPLIGWFSPGSLLGS